MRKTLLFALPLIAAAPLFAQGSAPAQFPGKPNPAWVSGGTYQVDPNHTLVGWRVNHFGFNDYFGIFGEVTGSLVLDPKKPAASKVDVTIPIGRVTTASAGLTGHLLRPGKDGGKPDFFGPEPAPARFVSHHVMVKGQSATIHGDLTLNGVTKPATLQAKFTGAGKSPAMMGGKENVGFHATATIKRSEFGIGYAIPAVSDTVTLDISVAFQK